MVENQRNRTPKISLDEIKISNNSSINTNIFCKKKKKKNEEEEIEIELNDLDEIKIEIESL